MARKEASRQLEGVFSEATGVTKLRKRNYLLSRISDRNYKKAGHGPKWRDFVSIEEERGNDVRVSSLF